MTPNILKRHPFRYLLYAACKTSFSIAPSSSLCFICFIGYTVCVWHILKATCGKAWERDWSKLGWVENKSHWHCSSLLFKGLNEFSDTDFWSNQICFHISSCLQNIPWQGFVIYFFVLWFLNIKTTILTVSFVPSSIYYAFCYHLSHAVHFMQYTFHICLCSTVYLLWCGIIFVSAFSLEDVLFHFISFY